MCIRIVTVIFSITMMAGYVVHSQLQQSRSLAPSSKLGLLSDASNPVKTTNHSRKAVAPGSKSLAPVLALQPATNPSTRAPRSEIAPGSKYAPVFSFDQGPRPQKAATAARSIDTLKTNLPSITQP